MDERQQFRKRSKVDRCCSFAVGCALHSSGSTGALGSRRGSREHGLLCYVWIVAIALAQAGCASQFYKFAAPPQAVPTESATAGPDAATRVNAITLGGEHPRLDRVERFLHYPAKKFRQWFPPKEAPLDPRIGRQAAVEKAQEYFAANVITGINIDIREYDPGEQWQRLRANSEMHPFWKYTGGLINHAQYTLLPDRVFHMDSYNPYTKTLSIGSSVPSSAVYQAGVAKVVRAKRYPGAFATASHLPIVPLYRDTLVANDVLSYARARGDWTTERELYPQIYGRFGADLVAQTTSVIPGISYLPYYYRPLMTMSGQVAGTATGKVVQHRREKELRYSTSLSPGRPVQAEPRLAQVPQLNF